MTTAAPAIAHRRSSWIPWIFVAAFAGVASVNGIMIWLALRSAPGLVAEHAYELGRHYNDELAGARAQERLGWTASLALEAGSVAFSAHTRDGAPVEGLAVDLVAFRPVEPGEPLRVALLEDRLGHYRAPLELARAGQWQLDLVARRGGEEFVLAKRIVVK